MKKQIIALGAALGLVAAVGVGSTLAYLTDTDAVTNTFTVGQVKIDLDETVDKLAEKTENRADYTKLLPGQEYDKVPVVTVKANSEKCYVFVEVIDEAEGVDVVEYNKAWEKLSENSNVYYKVVDATTEDKALEAIFSKVKVSEGVKEHNAQLGSISVKAYAIQFLGFDGADGAEEAWKEVSKKAEN